MQVYEGDFTFKIDLECIIWFVDDKVLVVFNNCKTKVSYSVIGIYVKL